MDLSWDVAAQSGRAPLWALSGSADPTFRNKPVTKIKPGFRDTCGRLRWRKAKASAQKLSPGPVIKLRRIYYRATFSHKRKTKASSRTYLTEAPQRQSPTTSSLAAPRLVLRRPLRGDVALRMRAGLKRVRDIGMPDGAELSCESDAVISSCQ